MILKHTSRSSGYKETSLKHGVVDVKWIQTLATTTLLLKTKKGWGHGQTLSMAYLSNVYGMQMMENGL